MPQSELASNLEAVREHLAHAVVATGRSAESVRLVAVTKTVELSTIREAYRLGVNLVGESRIQEALEKQAALSDLPLTWHLIGHLQTNKVKQAVGRFALIHSVDSLKLIRVIGAKAEEIGIRQGILLQVNVALEPTKYGFRPEEVPEALGEAVAHPGLEVRGFMTIAPRAVTPEASRLVFRQLRQLRETCQKQVGNRATLGELSMGMSSDYPVAIAEGATLVRIGAEIFGKRPGYAGHTEEGK